MDITILVAKRTTCTRRAVGAVIVKDKRILSTGYNGAPSGIRHCAEVGCLREKLNVQSGMRHELCRGIHAEQNAIIRHHPGGLPRGFGERRQPLLHDPALLHMREDADQRRHHDDLLSVRLCG